MRILTVCLGNICRSPLAAGILRKRCSDAGIDCTIDSCGTAAYHEGESADPRSISTAQAHGIDISSHRARQFELGDFELFDLILVMDTQNYENIIRLASTQEQRSKVRMILAGQDAKMGTEVPDPYYGGDEGFERVYRMLDMAAERIINEIAQKETT